MGNPKRLKPTTIITLDSHAAAFCCGVRRSLERDFGARGRLIQTHALVSENNSLRFESNLSSVSDSRFDLQVIRQEGKRKEGDAKALFEREIPKLQSSLIEILGTGRSRDEMDSALRDGVEISRDRMIYLLFSAADPVAAGLVLELAGFINWLFATKFSQEIHTLQAIVLLPDLFLNPEPPDYASTYSCLTALDNSLTRDQSSLEPRVLPFEGCWFMDGINALGDKIGNLAEKYESYSDAVAGFLMSEPERSGPPPGILRGKPAAYSSFGHAELYYPAEIVIDRLSNALARDITKSAFIGDGEGRQENRRALLLAAKEYVLSAKFIGSIEGLDREHGKPIWQSFEPRVQLEREGSVREHTSELQRRHEEFERRSLPGFQRSLLARAEQVRDELVVQLDAEIDRQADATPNGLATARDLLEKLIDPLIALEADALGEDPQNFISALRAAESSLDRELGVTIEDSRTRDLLSQVRELRSRSTSLRTTLRLAPAQVRTQTSTRAAGAGATQEGASREATQEERQSESDEIQSEHQRVIGDIEETEAQIQASCSEYEHALIEEQRAAYQARRAGQDQSREARTAAIALAEEEVKKLGDQLGEAKRLLDDLAQERRDFVNRYFIIYPALAALLIVIPGLGALVGIGPMLVLFGFLWENLFGFFIAILIAAIAYLIPITLKFMTGIHRRFIDARERIKTLEQSLRYAVIQLQRARNDQLKLEYDLYAQGRHVDTIDQLIEMTRNRIINVAETLGSLNDSYEESHRLYEKAIPSSSGMRRPVLSTASIDDYYLKVITDVGEDAESFLKQSVSRSQVRKIPLQQFREKLNAYTQERFHRLSTLTVQEILLQKFDLISAEEATRQLRELDNAAQPLIRLREIDAGNDQAAQRDVTLWAGIEDQSQLLSLYQRINPRADVRSSEDDQKLRALTRILNFPVYLLSQIEYYRARYEQSGRMAEDVPDPIPEEVSANRRLRHVHEQLLLALVTGVVTKGTDGHYSLLNRQGSSLGNERHEISEKFINEFASQKAYAELVASLKHPLSDHDAVFRQITDFLESATDLDSFERETLRTLARKYDPLG